MRGTLNEASPVGGGMCVGMLCLPCLKSHKGIISLGTH